MRIIRTPYDGFLGCICAICIGLLISPVIAAAPIVWTVQNAVFDDGGTLTGSFVYDADTESFYNVDLVTSVGPKFPGVTFSDADLQLSCCDAITLEINSGEGAHLGDQFFLFYFEEWLTNSGGVVEIATSSREAICLDNDCNYVDMRYITEGAVAAVPIPSAVWLFGSALAFLGWIRRKST
jgi:hypothetical protein